MRNWHRNKLHVMTIGQKDYKLFLREKPGKYIRMFERLPSVSLVLKISSTIRYNE